MYETNQNQRHNLLLQSNWKCVENSQRSRYLKVDCLQMVKKGWDWSWFVLHQRATKEIYQTPSQSYQANRQRKIGYCQSFQYHPFRGKKDQTITQSGSICHDCAQVFKKEEFNYEEAKLQEASFPEWSSHEA